MSSGVLNDTIAKRIVDARRSTVPGVAGRGRSITKRQWGRKGADCRAKAPGATPRDVPIDPREDSPRATPITNSVNEL